MNGLLYRAGSPSWLMQTVVTVIAVLDSGVMTIINLALTYTMAGGIEQEHEVRGRRPQHAR